MGKHRTISCDRCAHLLLRRDAYCDVCGHMARRERIRSIAGATWFACILIAVVIAHSLFTQLLR
jgi:hypothetical protein